MFLAQSPIYNPMILKYLFRHFQLRRKLTKVQHSIIHSLALTHFYHLMTGTLDDKKMQGDLKVIKLLIWASNSIKGTEMNLQ